MGNFQDLVTFLGYGLLCALLIAAASKLARPPYLNRLANWKPPNWLSKGVSTVSSALLLVLIADEVGLFFVEWGWEWSVFLTLREFLGRTGMAQLLETANIALVVPATYTIFSSYGPSFSNPEKKEARKRMRVQVCNVLVILLLYLTLVQLLVRNISTYTLILFFILTLYIIKSIFKILKNFNDNKKKIYSNNPQKAGLFSDIFVLSFALVSLQTIVTKAALLLVLIPRFSKPVLQKLRTVLPIRVDNPEEIDVDSLARRALGSSTSRIIGFYFFVSCLCPGLLLWQINVSPFPPLQAGFPKTQTINLVHVVSQMLMLWALGRRKTNPLLIGSGMAAMTLAWYGLPWLAPSWYGPAVDPPGSTIFSVFMSGEELARLAIPSASTSGGSFNQIINLFYLIPIFLLQISFLISFVLNRKISLLLRYSKKKASKLAHTVYLCITKETISKIGFYLSISSFCYLFLKEYVIFMDVLTEMSQSETFAEEANNKLKELHSLSEVSMILRGIGVSSVVIVSFVSAHEAWYGKSEVDLKCWGQLGNAKAQKLAERRPICGMFGSERPRSSQPNLWWLGWGFQIVIGLLLVWVATQVPKLPQL